MRITCFLASLCVLVPGLSCTPEPVAQPISASVPPANEIILFLTGNELGALKPCGCSGGQLGGLEKRKAIFDAVPAENRLLVATGGLVAGDREQDLIKFRILFEAFGLLGYDVVGLNRSDIQLAGTLGLLQGAETPFEMIGTGWGATEAGRSGAFSRSFGLAGRNTVVNIVVQDASLASADSAGGLFGDPAGGNSFNILILENVEAESIKPWTRVSGVDCIVSPANTDEPQRLSAAEERPLVFSTGRFGRYVCRLRVAFSKENGDLALQFDSIPVGETLPPDEMLTQLYKDYQRFVRESRLLEAYPRIPLPDDLSFVGSKACRPCHEYEYDAWSTKAHAHAFATLKAVGSDADPECVKCHVVGMEYEKGFITETTTPQLKDVGCENCHGPGSEHARTFGQQPTVPPKMTCLNCHTPEHSGGYAGHENEFMEKIIHWREP